MWFAQHLLGSRSAATVVHLGVQKLRLLWSIHSRRWQDVTKNSRRIREKTRLHRQNAEIDHLLFRSLQLDARSAPLKGKRHDFEKPLGIVENDFNFDVFFVFQLPHVFSDVGVSFAILDACNASTEDLSSSICFSMFSHFS